MLAIFNKKIFVKYYEMLLVLLGAESRSLVRRSEEAVAPPTGYLPAAEEDYSEDLAGYSADTFSLPGYSDGEELTRDTEGLSTTEAGELETTLPCDMVSM